MVSSQDFPRSSTVNKSSKIHSFNAGASPELGAPGKDATVYKHNDSDIRTYKPSSRHLDRRNVRFQGEDENSELESMKRELQNSADLLDQTRKTEEDHRDLKSELDDLRYRIRRVTDDIEYNKSGRRTEAKEQELRRLERELLFLRHEKLPDLEQSMRDRERLKRSDDRAAARRRDTRNNRSQYREESGGADSQREQSSGSSEEEEKGIKRPYGHDIKEKGRKARFDYDEAGKDRPLSRDSSRSTMEQAPSAPAAGPGFEANRSAPPPPLLREGPTQSHAKKQQTAEERQAFIRSEAQRRVQERMRVLSGQNVTPISNTESPGSSVDSSVAERLEQDRKAAAERSLIEVNAADEREKLRQIKLEEEKITHINQEKSKLNDRNKALNQVSNEITAAEMQNGTSAVEASAAAREELTSMERTLYDGDRALTTEKEVGQVKLRQMQNDLRGSDISDKPSKGNLGSKAKSPPPVPSSRAARVGSSKAPVIKLNGAAAVPLASTPASGSSMTAAPTDVSPSSDSPNLTGSLVALPHPATPQIVSPAPTKPNTNPFRLGLNTPTPSSGMTGKNPFFRPNTGASPALPPVVAFADPTGSKTKGSEEDWGDANEKSDGGEESSDEEIDGESVQRKRAGLADLLFGGAGASPAPASRPGSTRPETPLMGNLSASKSPSGSLPPL